MDKKYTPQDRYDAAHTTQVKLKLNDKTDADIIGWLNTRKNKQGYIKALIRGDMQRGDTYGQTGDHCSICKR